MAGEPETEADIGRDALAADQRAADERAAEIPGLRRARPAQEDPIARRLEARVRAALVGAEVEPTRVDRFVVLERLGAGGMGAVYAAFDPTLDRRVAVKLLHAAGARARERVLIEARALARLSHPNVVAVYDASAVGDDLYIAMELVAGTNLRRWLADAPRGVAEVIDVFVRAGRGLAAAHAAGLVHGDVKPENVLVGGAAGERVVKVADFGLARADGSGDERDARAGTPAYMAPEALAGAPADARADQFGFAVALYEALAGRRPYLGDTVGALRAAARAGVVPAIARPRGDEVPARVTRALERALRPDPAARFPSMTALVDAIAPPAPGRRARWLAGGAVALAGVAVAVALTTGARGDEQVCAAADARLASALPPGLRARLAPRITAALDAYGRGWSRMARDTCLATRRGEQSDAMLDLRMSCLDRRLDELGALAAVAADATTPRAIALAAEAAYALSPVEPCADRDGLAGVLPPPLVRRDAVAALRHRLDGVRARERTPAYRAALADARGIVADARTLAYPPVLAEALLAQATLENRAGDAVAAEAAVKDAIAAASAGRDDEVLALAWTQRVFFAGVQQERHAEALAYAEAGASAAAHTGNGEIARGFLAVYVGEIERRTDHLDRARASLDDAVRRFERARGRDHPNVAEALDVLADILREQGELPAARAAAERALAIYEATYGPDHQDTAIALGVLGDIAADAGRLDDALARYQDEARRLRAQLGDDNVSVAPARANVGNTLRRLGRVDEARVELEAARTAYAHTVGLGNADAINVLSSLARIEPDDARATAMFEDVLRRRIAVLGPAHHAVGDTLVDLGNRARVQGQLDRAIDDYQRARDIFERAFGPTHPRVSVALSNLGEAQLARGRFADAAATCARALAIDEPALGASHPDLAYDLICLGEAARGRGDAAGALPPLERAVALRHAGNVTPDERAAAEFALARALWAAGRDRPRAIALATAAAPDATPAAARAEIAAWLGARGAPAPAPPP